MHVGDLDDRSVSLSSTRWRARATIRVHGGAHTLVPGAVVRGRFGPNGPVVTCTTGTGGACTLTRDLKKTRASIVFIVVGLSKSGYAYVATNNHDPDGDSDGTRTTVTRPWTAGSRRSLGQALFPYESPREEVVSSWSVCSTPVAAVTVRVVGKKPPTSARAPPASTSHSRSPRPAGNRANRRVPSGSWRA